MTDAALKRTPLYDEHVRLGAKMIPFGDWIMPVQYSGIIDDLIVYRTSPESFLLVVNASRVDEDFAWLQKHLGNNGTLENRSSDYGGLAIQGPRVIELLQAMVGQDAELPAR